MQFNCYVHRFSLFFWLFIFFSPSQFLYYYFQQKKTAKWWLNTVGPRTLSIYLGFRTFASFFKIKRFLRQHIQHEHQHTFTSSIITDRLYIVHTRLTCGFVLTTENVGWRVIFLISLSLNLLSDFSFICVNCGM